MKNMISRRSFLAAAGVVTAAGVLTACGGSSSTAASTSTAASAAGSTAASGDTIKVGVIGPLTGDVSVYGQAVVNGATLSVSYTHLTLPTTSRRQRQMCIRDRPEAGQRKGRCQRQAA